jgi:transposase
MCEAITQPPAPSHPIARGRAGPRLLAHILFSKYGLHLPLNRQSAVYAREGIDLEVSTLADWVGAAAATLTALVEAIRTHVGPIIEAACWAHARRKFFDLARLTKAPIAMEAVERIDTLFAIEREINGLAPQERFAARHERSRQLVIALEAWLREQRVKVSGQSETGKAIAYSLTRWAALTRFLEDGRLCMSNNAAERELRGAAMGRKNWTFAGSDEGGRRAAAIYTLIRTAKLSDVHPEAWLADVLARILDHPAKRIGELLPWYWRADHRVAA